MVIRRSSQGDSADRDRNISSMTDMSYVNGTMDLQTGFEIMYYGQPNGPLSDAMIISPAKGGNRSYGRFNWTIVDLNKDAFKADPDLWTNLPDMCSPLLKAALLTKKMP